MHQRATGELVGGQAVQRLKCQHSVAYLLLPRGPPRALLLLRSCPPRALLCSRTLQLRLLHPHVSMQLRQRLHPAPPGLGNWMPCVVRMRRSAHPGSTGSAALWWGPVCVLGRVPRAGLVRLQGRQISTFGLLRVSCYGLTLRLRRCSSWRRCRTSRSLRSASSLACLQCIRTKLSSLRSVGRAVGAMLPVHRIYSCCLAAGVNRCLWYLTTACSGTAHAL